MSLFQKVAYKDLNSRQRENFNFQKVAAHLADYGFNCLRLSDDWQGADFLACHIDGTTVLRVQLKSRLIIDKKYNSKDIHIAFFEKGQWYLYPHDEVRDALLEKNLMVDSRSWIDRESYSWPELPKALEELMRSYAI